jgi:hypothetical protein
MHGDNTLDNNLQQKAYALPRIRAPFQMNRNHAEDTAPYTNHSLVETQPDI